MMKPIAYFGTIAALLFCLVFCILKQHYGPAAMAKKQEILENQNLVSALFLTDLSLWTEARYTRHPSQADFFSAFQDFPGAIEHFPAGSLVPPPAQIKTNLNQTILIQSR
jgi:hypothetical protein